MWVLQTESKKHFFELPFRAQCHAICSTYIKTLTVWNFDVIMSCVYNWFKLKTKCDYGPIMSFKLFQGVMQTHMIL